MSVGGKQGEAEGMFGVGVEYQTGNIYVSEYYKSRVQVLDDNGNICTSLKRK